MKEVKSDCPEDMGHQVEPVSLDASIMGNNSLRALVGLVRGLPSVELEKLGVPDTLDMRERAFYEAWFDEQRKYPWSTTAFYEERLSKRLDIPLEEVQSRLHTARAISGWLHKQFFGAEFEELPKE